MTDLIDCSRVSVEEYSHASLEQLSSFLVAHVRPVFLAQNGTCNVVSVTCSNSDILVVCTLQVSHSQKSMQKLHEGS